MNNAACQTHCCVEHGCKYGYPTCPVTMGTVKQQYPCEACEDVLPFEIEWSYFDTYGDIWHQAHGEHLDRVKDVFRHELVTEVMVTYDHAIKVRYRKKK